MPSLDNASPASSQQTMASADEMLSALEHVLANPHFPASDRRRTFLRYVVEETVAGRASQLKGYSVALAVFGRDESFDAQADPVVRIEARRLRRDLDSYYINAGTNDPLRISVPKGSYVPAFERQGPSREQIAKSLDDNASVAIVSEEIDVDLPSTRSSPHRRVRVAAAAAAMAIGALAFLLSSAAEGPQKCEVGACGPVVVVEPFDALNSSEASHHIASGITHELISNLTRFPSFRLFTFPVRLDPSKETVSAASGIEGGVAYSAGGSVSIGNEVVRVAAHLRNITTGQIVWAQTYERSFSPTALTRLQTELAGHIAGVIGQPYGAVNTDLDRRSAKTAASSMQSYICVIRKYDYRRGFEREKFDPAHDCLLDTVQRDPLYADAWAALAWLRIDAARKDYVPYGRAPELYEKAREAATRAEGLQPDNVSALKALAAVEYYTGNFSASERLSRRTLALNPHDPENLAQLGWRLAARGNFKEGIPFLERAIARTMTPPGWYYHLITIQQYLAGDYSGMHSSAAKSVHGGGPVSQFLIAIAAGQLREVRKVRKALEKLSRHRHFARDPAAYMRRHGVEEGIIRQLMSGYSKARETAS